MLEQEDGAYYEVDDFEHQGLCWWEIMFSWVPEEMGTLANSRGERRVYAGA